jgi:cation:H+ antiporter
MPVIYVLGVVGLAALVVGADMLVRGASRLAAAAGISPLVIGLTVVAFGTSSPEMAVSTTAALRGQPDLALGNVVGSNILNVLLILGLSAVIVPLVVSKQLLRLDVPVMIGASLAALGLAGNGLIGRLEGFALILSLIAYVAVLLRFEKKSRPLSSPDSPPHRGGRSWLLDIVLVVGGLFLLVLGPRWLLAAAIEVARAAGLSELIIGLTLVALGTSLPELASSVVAALRGERDIAVGNVVGSNILGVLGASAALAPNGISVTPPALGFDLPVMLAVAFVCLPVFFTGWTISRLEGAILLAYYAAYNAFLILDSNHHDSLPVLSALLVAVALPLTAGFLAVGIWRSMHAQRSARP